jgi:hypothetical protein
VAAVGGPNELNELKATVGEPDQARGGPREEAEPYLVSR